MKDLVRLRLAGILADEKKYAEALGLLETKHGESFEGLYADLKGDILSTTGKIAEARAAYQTAPQQDGRKGHLLQYCSNEARCSPGPARLPGCQAGWQLRCSQGFK